MSDNKPVLYHSPECGFCQRVVGTMINFKAKDHFTLKDILGNEAYKQELVDLCGDARVPTLVIENQPMRESETIIGWMVDKYAP